MDSTKMDVVTSSKPIVFQFSAAISDAFKSPAMRVALPVPVIAAYIVCGSALMTVYFAMAHREFSSILTLSAMMRCFGMMLLCFQVVSRRRARGLSVGTLTLEGISVALRLCSTTQLQGYLPADQTGDLLYQCIDGFTLVLVGFLIWRVSSAQKNAESDHGEKDSFNVWPAVLVAFVLAALLHGDMDNNAIFDTLWTAGLFTGVVAQLPQLWLVSQNEGCVEAFTSHYIVSTALSVILSGAFFYEAMADITCNMWIIPGFQHAIYAILLAHLVHLLILGDFTLYYARALVKSGPGELAIFLWV
jgi:hypothetical protein